MLGPKVQIAIAVLMLLPLSVLLTDPGTIFSLFGFLGLNPVIVLRVSVLWLLLLAFLLLLVGLVNLLRMRRTRRKEARLHGSRERELLETLKKEGELTAAAASAETSLTVAQADEMLREMAERGYVEARSRFEARFYSLWSASGTSPEGDVPRRLEGSS